MPYDMTEHRHRFASWAAARAVQRGWGSSKSEKLRGALESCGVREFLCTPESRDVEVRGFEDLHRQWCRAVIESLTQRGVAGATFGRAAKLVAVYLKVTVVLGPAGECNLSRVAHPPIDRKELQKLAAEAGIDSPHKRSWKTVNWTQLTEEDYYPLISQLHALIPLGDPFWTLEQHWNVADDA